MPGNLNQPSWVRKMLSEPPTHGPLYGVSSHELLSQESSLHEKILLTVDTLMEMTRLLAESIRSCPLSQLRKCEDLAIKVHASRTEFTHSVKEMDFRGEVKRRLVRLSLRLDRVGGMLRKVAERSCKREGSPTLGQTTAAELNGIFSELLNLLQGFHDHLLRSVRGDLLACVQQARALRDQARQFRVALCDGWYPGFCFTEETVSYWGDLDLMISMGKCLEEAAVALLELEGVGEPSAPPLQEHEHQKQSNRSSKGDLSGESSSEAFQFGKRKEEHAMKPKKILFCTDFSENSEPAHRLAMDYAECFSATLVLFHVVDPGDRRYPRFEDLIPYEETQKTLNEACDLKLNSMIEEVRKVIPSAKGYCGHGVPAKEIVDCAKEEGIDLIVIGTHGWTGLNRLLLGSTAENVVRIATCPVLVVRSFSPPS